MDTQPEDGFTLVELLVVMVILGVLAAIAVPTFLTQRDRAYATAMKSDLHSVVVAESSWAVDHATPTTDPVALAAEGWARTSGVSIPHVKVTAEAYVACVTHDSASHWLVYDSVTGQVTTSASDCL